VIEGSSLDHLDYLDHLDLLLIYRSSHTGPDGAQLLLLFAIRLENVAEQRAGRPIIDRDGLRREALAAEVTLWVEAYGMAKDHVFVTVLNPHRDESLAGLLHEAEAYAIGGFGPWLRGMAVAIVALVFASVRAQRSEVALEAALVSNDVLHDSSFTVKKSVRRAYVVTDSAPS
jgi:hypothetical protein